jgi:hypothetical protein
MAINHHIHGRDGTRPDLCDVCFWIDKYESMKCCGNCNEWQSDENGPGDCRWEGTQKNIVGIKPLQTSGDQGDGCAGWKLHESRKGN